jgi:hypothetical protein
VTTAGRPVLRLLPGGLSELTVGKGAARSAFHVVEVAQEWAALMIESGEAERLLESDSELAKLHFRLLDAVAELDGYAAGVQPPPYRDNDEGPAATSQ